MPHDSAPRMPRPLRVAFMAFGLANVGGAVAWALLRWAPWYVLPAGLVVGGAWSYVGYIGTIPTISTLPRALVPHARSAIEVQRGLAILKRRRLLAHWSFVVWFLPTVSLLAYGFERAAFGVGIAGVVLSGIFNLVWELSACPRCDNRFHALPSTAGMLSWHTKCCRSRGLNLTGRHDPSAT